MSVTNNFRVNTVTFTKNDGTSRTMNYISIQDLPSTITSAMGPQRNFGQNRELVWDVDNSGFRVVNFGTQVGSISTAHRQVTITQA
jgi:hypothetical protein